MTDGDMKKVIAVLSNSEVLFPRFVPNKSSLLIVLFHTMLLEVSSFKIMENNDISNR